VNPSRPRQDSEIWLPAAPGTASAAPLAFAIILVVCGDDGWAVLAGAGASLLIGFSLFAARWSRPWGRWGGAAGVLAGFSIVVVHAYHRPLLVLLLALACISFLFALWRRVPPYSPVPLRTKLVRPSGWLCTGAALTCLIASLEPGVWSSLAAASAAIAVVLAVIPLLIESISGTRVWRARIGSVALIAALAGTILVGVHGAPTGALAVSSLLALASVLSQAGLGDSSGRTLTDLLLDHPARLLVVTFVGLCVVGTLGLSMPWSAAGGASIGVLNAAFTSVSATCVTGLIVVDTPTAFSALGEVFVLVLIQAGGLGIMTISTSALSLLGRRLSLRQEAVMAALVSQENRADLYGALKRTLLVTVAFEAVGAILLTPAFARAGDGWLLASWRGLFTSVSAFCNAGFALQTDNLVPYQSNPVVLHVVGVLIIAGGLSPVALVALPRVVRKQRVGLQVKIALSTTAVLLVSSFAIVAAFEWGASLSHLGWIDRLHNAWFQAVTLRTAGFNSVDFAALRPATWMIMLILMFIGGCPGGTAGGLKTTTVFVLLLAVVGSLRGKTTADAFGRTIATQTVFKAAAAATMGVSSVVIAVSVLLLAQPLPFHVAVFEVVSALGTVGLSLGGTADLDEIGKIVIMVCMFLGRVGPLTVFLILSDRRAAPAWTLPEEEVEVG
jgi:trk/ktr system potassium uptake protein